MVLAAIVACEVLFWVFLAAGLLARYVLHRRRMGAALLVCVPGVDAALLGFTAVDLARGAAATSAHGVAAVYLGFSVVFGHSLVRWADIRVAHRFAGGPPPELKPVLGTWERAGLEWRDAAKAALAAGLSSGLLLTGIAAFDGRTDTSALTGWLVNLGWVLGVWVVALPGWATARAASVDAATRRSATRDVVR